jgi:tRNA threonylcarbamoyladenosine biosynthesis protein TsaE
MGSWSVASRSAVQTRRWGKRLGKLTQAGDIIGLIGELGAGKTTFVRGMAEGLEVGRDAWVRSPSFTLINEYHGRLPVYHIDLYRIESRAELETLNLRDYLFGDGVSIVEWFEHLPAGEVKELLEVGITYGTESNRELEFSPHGERYETMVGQLKGANSRFTGSRNFEGTKVIR